MKLVTVISIHVEPLSGFKVESNYNYAHYLKTWPRYYGGGLYTDTEKRNLPFACSEKILRKILFEVYFLIKKKKKKNPSVDSQSAEKAKKKKKTSFLFCECSLCEVVKIVQ